MVKYTPTWIYIGNKSEQINQNWNGHTQSEQATQLDEAVKVTGWKFFSREMKAVVINGDSTKNTFERGTTELRYSLDEYQEKTGVYTSHVGVDLGINVIQPDKSDPGTTINSVETVRGIIVQMSNGDLFIRPYYKDENQWNDVLRGWTITRIDVLGVAGSFIPSESNTDRFSNNLTASTSYTPTLFDDDTFAPCFTRGTLICTDRGDIPVELLKEGSLVKTLDNGLRPIYWIGRRKFNDQALQRNDNLRPILIRAGALGNGTPTSDLMVSPQHRVMLRSSIVCNMFGAEEVLIAAKQLCKMEGVEVCSSITEVEYFHILFDRHEIVISNGAETESLYAGPQALKSVSFAAREEIFKIFPELINCETLPPAARPIVRGKMAKNVASRHMKNKKSLVIDSRDKNE